MKPRTTLDNLLDILFVLVSGLITAGLLGLALRLLFSLAGE